MDQRDSAKVHSSWLMELEALAVRVLVERLLAEIEKKKPKNPLVPLRSLLAPVTVDRLSAEHSHLGEKEKKLLCRMHQNLCHLS